MEHLISNTKFGKHLKSLKNNFSIHQYYLDFYEATRNKYDNFLGTNLALNMIVPCNVVDGAWKPLEKPKNYKDFEDLYKSIEHDSDVELWYNKCVRYKEAEENVLFLGFEFKDVQPSVTYNYYHIGGNKIFEANNQYNFYPCHGHYTIEDIVRYKPKLTDTALKLIGMYKTP